MAAGCAGLRKQRNLISTLLKAIAGVQASPKILTIDGPAGSGKTTLAQTLREEVERSSTSVEISHMDDLYHGWGDALTETLTENLGKIIRQTSLPTIEHPVFDWNSNSYGSSRIISTPEVLILEGVGSGQRAIRGEISLSIWIDVEEERGLERVIARDGEQVQPFMKRWQTEQAKHFLLEGSMGAADYCLDGAPSA